MKELFQKSSNLFSFSKENRLAYKGGVDKPSGGSENADDAAFEEMMKGDLRGEIKEKADKLKGFDAPEVDLYEDEKEEPKKADESADVNDAIEYAKELSKNDISKIGKIKFSLEFDSQMKEAMEDAEGETYEGLFERGLTPYHQIDKISFYGDSELVGEDEQNFMENLRKAVGLVNDVQREMFGVAVNSPEWQNIKNYKVYRKKAKRYFAQLNKPLNRLSGKDRKAFLLQAVAFLEYGADKRAKDLITEIHKRPKDARNIIAKYSTPVRVEMAKVSHKNKI